MPEPSEPQAAATKMVPDISFRLILDRAPFVPLGTLSLPVLPREGDLLALQIDGRPAMAKVSWVNFHLGREPSPIDVAVTFDGAQPKAGNLIAQEEAIKKLMDFNTRLYEKASSHNNAMMLAGYAGLFAIWGFIKDFLSQNAALWIGLLTGTSILLFVIFELTSMYFRSIPFVRYAKANGKNPASILDQLPELDSRNAVTASRAAVFWQVIFYPTVICAFAAAALLMTNILLKLSNMSAWPT